MVQTVENIDIIALSINLAWLKLPVEHDYLPVSKIQIEQQTYHALKIVSTDVTLWGNCMNHVSSL